MKFTCVKRYIWLVFFVSFSYIKNYWKSFVFQQKIILNFTFLMHFLVGVHIFVVCLYLVTKKLLAKISPIYFLGKLKPLQCVKLNTKASRFHPNISMHKCSSLNGYSSRWIILHMFNTNEG